MFKASDASTFGVCHNHQALFFKYNTNDHLGATLDSLSRAHNTRKAMADNFLTGAICTVTERRNRASPPKSLNYIDFSESVEIFSFYNSTQKLYTRTCVFCF